MRTDQFGRTVSDEEWAGILKGAEESRARDAETAAECEAERIAKWREKCIYAEFHPRLIADLRQALESLGFDEVPEEFLNLHPAIRDSLAKIGVQSGAVINGKVFDFGVRDWVPAITGDNEAGVCDAEGNKPVVVAESQEATVAQPETPTRVARVIKANPAICEAGVQGGLGGRPDG